MRSPFNGMWWLQFAVALAILMRILAVGAVAAEPPSVTKLDPDRGPASGGIIVQVFGNGFARGATVMFGAVPARDVEVLSSHVIQVVLPPASGGTVDVRVANRRVTWMGMFGMNIPSAISPADRFTYQYQKKIVIYSISPGYGPPGTPITITSGVNGSGFVTGGVSQVDFVPDPQSPTSGCPSLSVPKADFTNLTDNQIELLAPNKAGAGLQLCIYDIGTTPISVPAAFNLGTTFMYLFTGAVPTVTGVFPGLGPAPGDTIVTIKGFGFTGATAVGFGPNPAKGFTVISDNQITATAPAGSGTVAVTVTTSVTTNPPNPDGGDTYTYEAAPVQPTITGISPQRGYTEGGTPITIKGSGFTQGMAVLFGRQSAYQSAYNVTWVSPTEMTAFSPPYAPGAVDVLVTTIPNGDLTSTATLADQFTYIPTPVWPLAPTGLTTTSDNPTGMTPDVILTWNPVGWMQTDNPNNTPSNPGRTNACSETDTYDVQISTDPNFPQGANTMLNSFSVRPNKHLPGMTNTPQCSGSSGQVTWSGGSFTLPWGMIDSPSVDTASQKLYVQVRSEFYGEAGPWSAAISFTVPAPQQFFVPKLQPDLCQDNNSDTNRTTQDTFSCLPWLPVEHAIGYEVRMGLASAFPEGSLPTDNGVCPKLGCQDQLGSIGTNNNDDLAGTADRWEPWCGPYMFFINPAPWCAFYPTAPPYAQTFPDSVFPPYTHPVYQDGLNKIFWMVRATYAPGWHGPWSPTFSADLTTMQATPIEGAFGQQADLMINFMLPVASCAPDAIDMCNTVFDTQAGMWFFGTWVSDIPGSGSGSSASSPGKTKTCFGKYVPSSPNANALLVSSACGSPTAIKFTASRFSTSTTSTEGGNQFEIARTGYLATGLKPGLWNIGLVFTDKCMDRYFYFISNVPVAAEPTGLTFPNTLLVNPTGATDLWYNASAKQIVSQNLQPEEGAFLFTPPTGTGNCPVIGGDASGD